MIVQFLRKTLLIIGLMFRLHDASAEEDPAQILLLEQQLMEACAEEGCVCVEEAGTIDMMNPGLLSEAVSAPGTERELLLVSVDAHANLKYYQLQFQKDGSLQVRKNTVTWHTAKKSADLTDSEKRAAIGTAEETFTAQDWSYSEGGYFFIRRAYPDGWDGSHEQIGYRVTPLPEACVEANRNYVSMIGYENCAMLTSDWSPEDMDAFPIMDAFEKLFFYEHGCSAYAYYGVSYAAITGDVHAERPAAEIPPEDFESLIRRYFDLDPGKIRELGMDPETGTYLLSSLSFDEIDTPYPPVPEVTRIEEQKDGTVLLEIHGVSTQEADDAYYTGELVVRPFPDGTWQYLSNTMIQ